jgi:hypothetical protein
MNVNDYQGKILSKIDRSISKKQELDTLVSQSFDKCTSFDGINESLDDLSFSIDYKAKIEKQAMILFNTISRKKDFQQACSYYWNGLCQYIQTETQICDYGDNKCSLLTIPLLEFSLHLLRCKNCSHQHVQVVPTFEKLQFQLFSPSTTCPTCSTQMVLKEKKVIKDRAGLGSFLVEIKVKHNLSESRTQLVDIASDLYNKYLTFLTCRKLCTKLTTYERKARFFFTTFLHELLINFEKNDDNNSLRRMNEYFKDFNHAFTLDNNIVKI